MLKSILVLVAISVDLLSTRCDGGESLRSNVSGLAALSLVLQDSQLQTELEISPAQLAQLKELEQKVGSDVAFRLPQEEVNQIATLDDPLAFIEKAHNKVLIPRFEAILKPSQRDYLRTKVLRKRIPSPQWALLPYVLEEFEIQPLAIEAAQKRWEKLKAELDARIDVRREEALQEVIRHYSAEQKQKFVDALGDLYLPPGMVQRSCRASDAIVFGEARRCGALMIEAGGSTMNVQRRDAITELRVKLLETNDNVLVSKELNAFLTEEEKVELTQRVQQRLLQQDLKPLAGVEMSRFLELDEEQIEQTKRLVDAAQADMDATRKAGEFVIFDKILKTLPPKNAAELKAFFKNVWQ